MVTTRLKRSLGWALAAAGLFLVTLVPYVVGWWTVPPDLVYLGLTFDVPDHTQYWAWVTASQQGLFISNTMTPEANPPTFLNPMMWLLAAVQRALDLEFAALFQVWRLAATGVVVAATVWTTQIFVGDPDVRRTARWVVLVGAGLGWVHVASKVALGLPDAPYPTDIYTVEPNTFWALLSYPYLALAQGLVMVTLASVWLASRDPRPARIAAAVAAAFLLSATHAYDLLIVFGVLGAIIGAMTIRHRRPPWRLIAICACAAAASLPLALYYRHLTTATPLWRSILAQYANAGVWTPSPAHLVILMGVPLVLALLAIRPRWRQGTDEDLAIVAWAVVGGVLPYLPVVYQIKLLTAWQVPLAILAAHAWHHLWERGGLVFARTRWRGRMAATIALVMLVVPTNLYLVAWRVIDLQRHSTPYYVHQDERAALAWLAAHGAPNDVVLAREEFGRLVPGYSGRRAVLAHWAMTNRYFDRRSAVNAYFSSEVPERERLALASAVGATLVAWSAPPGLLPAPVDPGVSDSRTLVFERPRARIYRVRSAPPEPAL